MRYRRGPEPARPHLDPPRRRRPAVRGLPARRVPRVEERRVTGPVIGEDGLARCPWADGDPAMRAYHDEEWGLPVRGERGLFERLTLEAFQSGLSWRTILNKRPGFRAAFRDFDAD